MAQIVKMKVGGVRFFCNLRPVIGNSATGSDFIVVIEIGENKSGDFPLFIQWVFAGLSSSL